MSRIGFTKGHGTGNDFIIILDPENQIELSEQQIQRLCDRHFGIGADGVLHAVQDSLWFMDYRNRDGSVAEMCGNGIRVFAEFLYRHAFISESAQIGTRAGVKHVERNGTDSWSVNMGNAQIFTEWIDVKLGNDAFNARSVNVGNPHLVVEVASLSELPATLLWDDVADVPSHPEGFNLEFYEVLSESLVSMRVLERGVGETLSCGTGVCAVAQVHMQARNIGACEVKVPGGQLMVQESSGELVLTGLVELIADGFVELT